VQKNISQGQQIPPVSLRSRVGMTTVKGKRSGVGMTRVLGGGRVSYDLQKAGPAELVAILRIRSGWQDLDFGHKPNQLHDEIFSAVGNGMLHFGEVVLHHVEAVNAAFEVARQAGEQGSDLGVFKVLELRHDVIAFFAGLDPLHEILQAIAAEAEVVDAFRKHSGEEQCVVADMLAHLALAVERGRGTVDGIGLKQHLADIGERAIAGSVNLEQLIGVAKFREQVRDVCDQLLVADADLLRIVPPYQFQEELPQRM
jgi:hypothetical protein